MGFPGGASGMNLQCRRCKRRRFDPWVRKIPWRGERQPVPVFLPGRQRSLVGYSPRGCKESDKVLKSQTQLKQLGKYAHKKYIY